MTDIPSSRVWDIGAQHCTRRLSRHRSTLTHMSMVAAGFHHSDSNSQVTLEAAFSWQSQRCAASGAPIASRVLDVCAQTAPRWAEDVGVSNTMRFGDHIPLRVMAALHFLALTRAAPSLAMQLPTVGGTASADSPKFDAAVLDALRSHHATLRNFLSRQPQTNEPGRQSALKMALSACALSKPVDLVELGCSAGLNLAVDVRDINAPIITSRRGCDLNPIDVTTVDGRARISAYVWADDVARFNALGRAIEAARTCRIEIAQADAAGFVRSLQPTEGHTLLVWTSAFAPYLPASASDELAAATTALAGRMSKDSELVQAAWEDAGDTSDPTRTFALTLTRWHHGGDREVKVLARGSAHGALAQQ